MYNVLSRVVKSIVRLHYTQSRELLFNHHIYIYQALLYFMVILNINGVLYGTIYVIFLLYSPVPLHLFLVFLSALLFLTFFFFHCPFQTFLFLSLSLLFCPFYRTIFSFSPSVLSFSFCLIKIAIVFPFFSFNLSHPIIFCLFPQSTVSLFFRSFSHFSS